MTGSLSTVAVSGKSKKVIGDLSLSPVDAIVDSLLPCSSILLFRTTCGLVRPSFSDILRSGVGIDSGAPTVGRTWVFALLLLRLAIRCPMFDGVEVMEIFFKSRSSAAGVPKVAVGVDTCVLGVRYARVDMMELSVIDNLNIGDDDAVDCKGWQVA